MRSLGELFVGPGKSSLRAGQELIVGFHIPLRKPNEGSGFRRIMRPQGVALPIINLAVWIQREGNRVEAARIAVGPGGPKPWRARAAETSLVGKSATDEDFAAALDALLTDVTFRSSPRRATAEYRRYLVPALFAEAAKAAWDTAASKGN